MADSRSAIPRYYKMPRTKAEYVEGPQAVANFERFATAVMQAPKPSKNPRKLSTAKTKKSDKN